MRDGGEGFKSNQIRFSRLCDTKFATLDAREGSTVQSERHILMLNIHIVLYREVDCSERYDGRRDLIGTRIRDVVKLHQKVPRWAAARSAVLLSMHRRCKQCERPLEDFRYTMYEEIIPENPRCSYRQPPAAPIRDRHSHRNRQSTSSTSVRTQDCTNRTA